MRLARPGVLLLALASVTGICAPAAKADYPAVWEWIYVDGWDFSTICIAQPYKAVPPILQQIYSNLPTCDALYASYGESAPPCSYQNQPINDSFSWCSISRLACWPGDTVYVDYTAPHDFMCRTGGYTVKITPLGIATESSTILASLAPIGTGLTTSTQLVARVYDQSGNVVPDVDVTLTLQPVPGSGGHAHDQGDPSRPAGALNGFASPQADGLPFPLEGTTGSGGLVFTYTAPQASGDYRIVASCTSQTCTQQSPDTVRVGIRGLVAIPPNNSEYILVGQDAAHPDNHYLTPQALAKLTKLATLYHQQFPNDPVLYLNDASLPYGGLFDIYYQGRVLYWMPPHSEHRSGIVIDIRANPQENPTTAIPEKNDLAFEKLIRMIGGNFLHEDPGTPNEHFHVRLLGNKG